MKTNIAFHTKERRGWSAEVGPISDWTYCVIAAGREFAGSPVGDWTYSQTGGRGPSGNRGGFSR